MNQIEKDMHVVVRGARKWSIIGLLHASSKLWLIVACCDIDLLEVPAKAF